MTSQEHLPWCKTCLRVWPYSSLASSSSSSSSARLQIEPRAEPRKDRKRHQNYRRSEEDSEYHQQDRYNQRRRSRNRKYFNSSKDFSRSDRYNNNHRYRSNKTSSKEIYNSDSQNRYSRVNQNEQREYYDQVDTTTANKKTYVEQDEEELGQEEESKYQLEGDSKCTEDENSVHRSKNQMYDELDPHVSSATADQEDVEDGELSMA